MTARAATPTRPRPKCRFCGGNVEYFADPDGSCDYHCTICTWSEHIPSDDEAAEAKREVAEISKAP